MLLEVLLKIELDADFDDERWMERALGLADRSVGLSSPNPMVGCVIVSEGAVAGEGWHEYSRRDHAEIVALAAAGERARGATAYVTLEPCSHQGRTGPCSDALIRAGVSRVVAATVDPNPLVSGAGFSRLRAAGIGVTTAVGQARARRLNDAFAKYIRTGIPLVTLKAAVSADGRIAPDAAGRVPGTPFWITGPGSREAVQQLRHASDALLSGIDTVLNDDPLLTDRTGLPRRRGLLRVVLDSRLRLGGEAGLKSRLVRSAEEDVLVFCTHAELDHRIALEERGVRVEEVSGERLTAGVGDLQAPGPGEVSGSSATAAGRVPIKDVLQRLGELAVTSVMIEAGARVNTSALGEGLVDRLLLFHAPERIGRSGVPVVYGVDDSILGDGGRLARHFGFERLEGQQSGSDLVIEASRGDFWG
ncbi:MAG TPA: bifunctional diaminohydroxyphosphoribosylaminopyrimidine deaminase/5-amino-6-(5-phosphoribosylamino)uracil reductase RibD [Acidisarcina sp.]